MKFRLTLLGLLAIALAIAALVLTGRRSDLPPQRDITLVDDEGIRTTLARPANRIITIAPQFTEMLFAIGAGDSIIGTGGVETFPPEATAIESVSGEDGSVDLARVSAIKADLVLTSGPPADYKQILRTGRTPVVTLNASSLQDALDDMKTVTRLAGFAPKGSQLVSRIRTQLGEINEAKTRPLVFIETFYPPLAAAPETGYLADLVRASGGEVTASTEAAQVYLAFASSAISADAVKSRPGFAYLKDRRVLVLPDDLFLRPGPRLYEGAMKLNAILQKL